MSLVQFFEEVETSLVMHLVSHLFGELFTSQAEKVPTGYKNPDQEVLYPDLSIVFGSDVRNKQLLEKLAHSIFSVNLLHQKLLKPFRNSMLASLLMFHGSLTVTCSPTHLIVQPVVAAARHLEIFPLTLIEWGKKIKENFHRKNTANSVVGGSTEERATIEIRRLRQDKVILTTRLEKIESLMLNMVQARQQMSDQLATIVGHQSKK